MEADVQLHSPDDSSQTETAVHVKQKNDWAAEPLWTVLETKEIFSNSRDSISGPCSTWQLAVPTTRTLCRFPK